jgi:hypothetical protein
MGSNLVVTEKDSQYTDLTRFRQTAYGIIHTKLSAVKPLNLLLVYRARMKLRLPFEAWMWIAALLGLAILGPWLDGRASFCIPSALGSALGFDFCWGCGLGRSITKAFHGDLLGSWNDHPLGMFAILTLLVRIITLIHPSLKDPS